MYYEFFRYFGNQRLMKWMNHIFIYYLVKCSVVPWLCQT